VLADSSARRAINSGPAKVEHAPQDVLVEPEDHASSWGAISRLPGRRLPGMRRRSSNALGVSRSDH